MFSPNVEVICTYIFTAALGALIKYLVTESVWGTETLNIRWAFVQTTLKGYFSLHPFSILFICSGVNSYVTGEWKPWTRELVCMFLQNTKISTTIFLVDHLARNNINTEGRHSEKHTVGLWWVVYNLRSACTMLKLAWPLNIIWLAWNVLLTHMLTLMLCKREASRYTDYKHTHTHTHTHTLKHTHFFPRWVAKINTKHTTLILFAWLWCQSEVLWRGERFASLCNAWTHTCTCK